MTAPAPDITWAARCGAGIEATDDAAWPWWSLTKTVLAAAILRLHEAEGLDLDAPTRLHPATLRQLLAHTGGVPSYTRLPDYAAAVAERGAAWPLDEMLARIGREPSEFAPGTGWSYSNTGYAILRRMVEEATDAPIDHALRSLVLDPLDLPRVAIATTPGEGACAMLDAEGYDPAWVYHGLACGSAAGAVRLLDGLFGGDVLRPATRALLLDATALGGALPGRPWRSAAYGLGVMCGEMADVGRVAGHSGSGPFSVSAAYRVEAPDGPRTACAFARGDREARAEWAVQALLAR